MTGTGQGLTWPGDASPDVCADATRMSYKRACCHLTGTDILSRTESVGRRDGEGGRERATHKAWKAEGVDPTICQSPIPGFRHLSSQDLLLQLLDQGGCHSRRAPDSPGGEVRTDRPPCPLGDHFALILSCFVSLSSPTCRNLGQYLSEEKPSRTLSLAPCGPE